MDLAYLESHNLATLLKFSWHKQIPISSFKNTEPAIVFYEQSINSNIPGLPVRVLVYEDIAVNYKEYASLPYVLDENPYKEYIFGLKPQTLNVKKNKIANKKLDLSGIIVEHWLNDMQVFEFNGNTGSLEPLYDNMSNLKSSAIYQWFYQLDMFIQRNNQDILMQYEGLKYWGFFTNFNYKEDANSPFNINYAFTFSVYPYDGARNDFKTSADREIGDATSVIEAQVDNNPQIINFGNDTNYEEYDTRERKFDTTPTTPGSLSVADLWNNNALGAHRYKKTAVQMALHFDAIKQEKINLIASHSEVGLPF